MPSLRGLALSSLVVVSGIAIYVWNKDSDFDPQLYS
jgi:hypothetical protein